MFYGLLVVGWAQIGTQREVRVYNTFRNPGSTARISEPCRTIDIEFNFFQIISWQNLKRINLGEVTKFTLAVKFTLFFWI
jgi:hypothetical protein